MKNASKTMFNIGNIFNIVLIALGALLVLIGIICFAAGGPEAAAPAGYCIGWGIYFLVTSILCLVFVGKAKKELEDESRKDNKPFIITIIFGAISDNVFYVLAGIFGLIAEGQQGSAQPKEEPKQIEQEEKKDEE